MPPELNEYVPYPQKPLFNSQIHTNTYVRNTYVSLSGDPLKKAETEFKNRIQRNRIQRNRIQRNRIQRNKLKRGSKKVFFR
ncbi:hypothetical protein [Methanosarcina lacustris]|uniref:hypothetical protein n=1 Tax=Methanosarcina lacustris TaxID=170861 RepID=UPI00064F5CE4|nr:hypothetical protein [Methanosarcina lacustris]